jgi:hypothetical protein
VENTNQPDEKVRVVLEVLPGDSELIFREISQEDFENRHFSPDTAVNPESFPTKPYPFIDPAKCCLDRVWTQTIIKIKSDITTWNLDSKPENIRVFDVAGNNKGLLCPFNAGRCQEGWCQGCGVYLRRYL